MSHKRNHVASTSTESEQATLEPDEFIVDSILAEKRTATGLLYLIKW